MTSIYICVCTVINKSKTKNDYFCKTCSNKDTEYGTLWSSFESLSAANNDGYLVIMPGSHKFKNYDMMDKKRATNEVNI